MTISFERYSLDTLHAKFPELSPEQLNTLWLLRNTAFHADIFLSRLRPLINTLGKLPRDEEIDNPRLGVSVAILILAADRIQASQRLARGKVTPIDFRLLEPRVNNVGYAKAIAEAANYVRHIEEWLHNPEQARKERWSSVNTNNILLGRDVLEGEPNEAERLVATLGLDNLHATETLFSQWGDNCLQHIAQQLLSPANEAR